MTAAKAKATPDWTEEFGKPFALKETKWRVGQKMQSNEKGMALAYIDARCVMDRLDDVVGPMGWRTSFEFAGPRTVCTLEIWDDIKQAWVGKSDGSGDSDIEGEKGGLSGAFKRAAVHWGIGRYLYALPAPWVKIVPAGRSFKISPTEFPMLDKIAAGEPAPKEYIQPEEDAPKPARGNQNNPPPPPSPPAPEDQNQDQPSHGVLLLEAMQARCRRMGVSDEGAATFLAKIVSEDMGLAKEAAVLARKFDAILQRVEEWTPAG